MSSCTAEPVVDECTVVRVDGDPARTLTSASRAAAKAVVANDNPITTAMVNAFAIRSPLPFFPRSSINNTSALQFPMHLIRSN
jgi:hypothetical protein